MLVLSPAAARAHCAPAAMPATVEWSWWIGAGLGARDLATPRERLVPELVLGGSVGFVAMQFAGDHELRVGPYLSAQTDTTGARGEGGLELTFTRGTEASDFGTLAFRIGGGYGADDLGQTPSLAMTLTWGVRSVAGRVGGDAGRCFGLGVEFVGPEHALAQSFRGFVTARAIFGAERDWTLVAGLEVDLLLWFPPYQIERLRGDGTPGY